MQMNSGLKYLKFWNIQSLSLYPFLIFILGNLLFRSTVVPQYWYPKNKLIYRQYAKQYDEAVKSYHSLRELDIAKSKNISRFYAYVNSKLNSSVGIPPLLSDDGTLKIVTNVNISINTLFLFLLKTMANTNIFLFVYKAQNL